MPERGQVAHHAPALLLPVLQLLLLIGFSLVADDFGVFRLWHVGVESLSLPFLIPVLLRRGEDEPHAARKSVEAAATPAKRASFDFFIFVSPFE